MNATASSFGNPTSYEEEKQLGFCFSREALCGLVIRGETYRWREKLKEAGFRWDADRKEWRLDDRATDAANFLAKEIAVARDMARNQEPPLYVATDSGTPERREEEQRHRAERPDLFIEMGWY